jgi:hypothetical protein
MSLRRIQGDDLSTRESAEVLEMAKELQHLNSEEISMLLNNEVICEETKSRVESHLCECIECSAWLETMKEFDQMSPETSPGLTEDEENYFLADLHRRIALLKIDDDNGNIYRERNLIHEDTLINNEIAITPESSPFKEVNALSASKPIYIKYRIVEKLLSVYIAILYKTFRSLVCTTIRQLCNIHINQKGSKNIFINNILSSLHIKAPRSTILSIIGLSTIFTRMTKRIYMPLFFKKKSK